MKYVMFRCRRKGTDHKVPVIFPNFMVHADVALAMQAVLVNAHKYLKVEPVSAGEFNVTTGEASGRSTTLGLKSKATDGQVIRTYDYFQGIT